jgi:hypothetical protein
MSQQVDLSTPLTDEEYRYLVSRSRGDLIERAHAMHGTSDADYAGALKGDGSGPQPQPVLQGEARAARRDQLLAELAALDEAEATDEDDEDDEADESDGDEDTRPYAEWTVPELDAQLKARELPTSGTKPEKVKRLEEDDAAA